jgi:asparagine synthase (glutamine-hydrolysing)
MCGIAGFLMPQGGNAETLRAQAAAMGEAIRHRGPDGDGVWIDAANGVGFAHRRLSIIDLTTAAAQPMALSEDGCALSYNGEIYNFLELTQELRAAGHEVRGEGDTAMLYAALKVWGVDKSLAKINGMFAFAWWDGARRQLILARDRLGIKPLYWAETLQGCLFGSELRALLAHPACSREIEPQALAHYLRFNNVPASAAIFKGIHKLSPAHKVTFAAGQAPVISCYWNLPQLVSQAVPATDDFTEATAQLKNLLRTVVGQHMIADVPLGALLSGGIDSSLVTALMQEQASRPVKTFSVGFESTDFDEAPSARAIAAHLGTEHYETYVTAAEAQAVIPSLPKFYSEPFADSSQIPTYLVAKAAKQHVTVVLSGDGGDEGFLGYNRYRAWDSMERTPAWLLALVSSLTGLVSADRLNRWGQSLPPKLRVPQLGDKMMKLAALRQGDVADVYQRLTACWPEPELLLPDTTPLPPVLPQPVPDDPVAAMQLWDLLGYLPDDVLTKVDIASMAVALEIRVPLLDHRVLEYSLSLPRSMKLQRGVTKRILRQILKDYVPTELTERPKSGFGVPLADWLRGPLKPWAMDLLTGKNLLAAGLAPAPVLAVLHEHLSNHSNHQHRLWTILSYLSWRQEWCLLN